MSPCNKNRKTGKCIERKRCNNGTRKNKNTGECEKYYKSIINQSRDKTERIIKKRCDNGSRRNKKSGICEFPMPKNVKKPTQREFDAIVEKLEKMYDKMPIISHETYDDWLLVSKERRLDRLRGNLDLFKIKAKTLRITEKLVVDYIHYSNDNDFEYDMYVEGNGDMKEVAQLMISRLLFALTSHYKNVDFDPNLPLSFR